MLEQCEANRPAAGLSNIYDHKNITDNVIEWPYNRLLTRSLMTLKQITDNVI